MQVQYLSSYDRSFKKLSRPIQNQAVQAIDNLISYFQTGQKSLGLGLRILRKPYWEIRVGLQIRILFRLEKDLLTFVHVGTHDDLKRLLRHL